MRRSVANTDCNPDGNSGCKRYAYRDGDGDGDGDSNSNCYSNGDCDRTAAAFTDATASADTAASPLACCGIRGTREN